MQIRGRRMGVGCAGLLTKFKRRRKNERLPEHKRKWNKVQEFYRNRIENVISQIKRHRMFDRQGYNGKLQFISMYARIVGELTALEIRMFGPRFRGFGPHAHHY